MAEKRARLLDVLIKTYDGVDHAEDDLRALRELHEGLRTSYNCDAAMVRKTGKGVRVERSYAAGRRHEALGGLRFGIADGLVAAIFPANGVVAAALAGGARGEAIGVIVGHIESGIPRGDLDRIGALLDGSEVALVVVYQTNLARQIAKKIEAADRVIARVADLEAREITEQVMHADA